jgi:hypothetical protein
MRIPTVLSAYVLIGCLMVSCGLGRAPKELTVAVPHNFSGSLHIHMCDDNAPENNITANDKGEVSTSTCLGKNEEVQLRIVGKDGIEVIPANLVRIDRTGDGIATVVEAKITAD